MRDEGDLLAVGRPDRVGILIDAGVEIEQRLRGDVVDANERMIGAVGDEGDAGSHRATSEGRRPRPWRG